jgi:hypothetical protein
MKSRDFRLIVATLTLCASVALASFTVVAQPPSTLYHRLGGKTAIVAVVDEFVARVAADKRMNSLFTGVASDPTRLAVSRRNSWIKSAKPVGALANTRVRI